MSVEGAAKSAVDVGFRLAESKGASDDGLSLEVSKKGEGDITA